MQEMVSLRAATFPVVAAASTVVATAATAATVPLVSHILGVRIRYRALFTLNDQTGLLWSSIVIYFNTLVSGQMAITRMITMDGIFSRTNFP